MLLFSILSILIKKCSAELTFGSKTIKSATNPELYVSSFHKIFRLKKTFDPITGLESNVVQFKELDDGYEIVVNDEPMCLASTKNPEVVSCKILENKEKTKWTVTETPKGSFIKTSGFCLSGGMFDERTAVEGYKLTVEKCESENASLWHITPIESLVYNGDMSDIMKEGHLAGRNPIFEDYANHSPGSNPDYGPKAYDWNLTAMEDRKFGYF